MNERNLVENAGWGLNEWCEEEKLGEQGWMNGVRK
jgi:hypothetical protein